MFADKDLLTRSDINMEYAENEYRDKYPADIDVAANSGDMDMPEGLSAKCKSVSVQTDKSCKQEIENLFDGFSEKQMKTFLAMFLAKREHGSSADIERSNQSNFKVRWVTKVSINKAQ